MDPNTPVHDTLAYKQTMEGTVPYAQKYLMKQVLNNGQYTMTVVHVDLVDNYRDLGLEEIGSVVELGVSKLGLKVEPLADLRAEEGGDASSMPGGCQVVLVVPNSPAARGGFKEGDIITTLGKHQTPVDNIESLVYSYTMEGDTKNLETTDIYVQRTDACCVQSSLILHLKFDKTEGDSQNECTLCCF